MRRSPTGCGSRPWRSLCSFGSRCSANSRASVYSYLHRGLVARYEAGARQHAAAAEPAAAEPWRRLCLFESMRVLPIDTHQPTSTCTMARLRATRSSPTRCSSRPWCACLASTRMLCRGCTSDHREAAACEHSGHVHAQHSAPAHYIQYGASAFQKLSVRRNASHNRFGVQSRLQDAGGGDAICHRPQTSARICCGASPSHSITSEP